jgi:hypothetical protein
MEQIRDAADGYAHPSKIRNLQKMNLYVKKGTSLTHEIHTLLDPLC